MKFWQDLRRRHVFRLIGFYIVGAWLVIQVASTFFPAWGIPDTALRYLIIAAVLCFPIAVVFSWFYDITPDGIVRTVQSVDEGDLDYRLKRTDYMILSALAAVAITVIYGSVTKVQETTTEQPVAVETAPNSIAVLPFSNYDDDPNTKYFSDGVTEEILHRLSEFAALKVMARTSSFAFADSDMTIPRISGLLGVRYLLQGSVRRDLDQVRITAQLVDNSGLQVWSQSFDRKLEGIFVIQTEIANAVARQLVAQVVPRALNDARTTTSMDAYQEYLVGREYLYTRSPGWTRNAATAFRHAIELDGGYAPAYAGLAVATQLGGPDSRDEIESNRKSARAYAVKALALDPDLAEAHAALGLIILDGPDADALAAETSLRRAIELDPTVSNAYNWLANALLAQNKRAEARLVRQQGLQSDPLNPIMNVNLANQYLNVGDFERAESLLLRLLDLPSPPEHAYGSLFELYANYGRMIDALHILIRGEQAGDVPDSSEFFYGIADFLQVLGLRNDADYWYTRGSDIDPIPTRILIRKARMLKVYGDYDELRTLLDDAYQNNRINEAAIPYSAREVLVPIKVFADDYVGGISTAESVIDIENLPRTDGEPSIGTIDLLHALAYGYRMAGLPQKADAILDYLQALFQEMQQQGTVGNPLMAAQQALNHAMRNDMAAAEAALADAVDAGWRNYWYVANDPRWQELLELPGVAPIIAKVTADLELQAREVEVILTNLDL